VVVGSEFEKIVMDPSKDVFVKFYAPWCGHCKSLAPIWDELGEAFKDQADVVIAEFDVTENEADGVDIKGLPTLKWYPKGNKEGIVYSGDRELREFERFINGGYIKSEDVPETQGNVIDLVGTQFEKIVMDPTKDVFVKFYAPWCGHCKALAPVWEELGEAYKDQPDVIIARFDATKNEAPGFKIEGYPTVKLFSKANKEGIDY